MVSATISTTMNRERKRRTRVGALMCASRSTSSSTIVCAIWSATTAAASSPIASMTICADCSDSPAVQARHPMAAAIATRTSAPAAKSAAMSE